MVKILIGVNQILCYTLGRQISRNFEKINFHIWPIWDAQKWFADKSTQNDHYEEEVTRNHFDELKYVQDRKGTAYPKMTIKERCKPPPKIPHYTTQRCQVLCARLACTQLSILVGEDKSSDRRSALLAPAPLYFSIYHPTSQSVKCTKYTFPPRLRKESLRNRKAKSVTT